MNYRLLHTPEGVRDIYVDEASRKNELQNRIMSILYSYGFKNVQTPTFEYIDVFHHDQGTVDSNRMYKFSDRDGNLLALRPDITPSIARFAATSFEEKPLYQRLCYLGNTFRNNEALQGKLREFTQAGVEFIGNDSPDADAEMIAILVNCLLVSGLTSFQIEIGQAGFFKALVEDSGLSRKNEDELRGLIDEKNYISLEELIKDLKIDERNKAALLDLPKLFGTIDVIEKARKMTDSEKALKELERIEQVYEILKDYGIDKYISVDLGMVSSLNYYTGIVFRAYTFGTGASIADGGRYNSLIQQFGKDAPSVGFAIIIDGLMTALERQGIKLPIEEIHTLLLYNPSSRKIAIGISESMRAQEMNIEVGLLQKTIEENIDYGKKRNIGGIMNFISEDEVQLINLTTDERQLIPVSELFEEDDHVHYHGTDDGEGEIL